MRHARLRWVVRGSELVLAAVLFLSTGCAETDRDLYTAFEPAVATFRNPLEAIPVYLPGCSPFVIERSLEGAWINVGPPFVCFWEGFAVPVGMNGSLETSFHAPTDTGIYRLRYAIGAHCAPDLPLSQAGCQFESFVRSNEFEVERELCDPDEFGCRFVPGAPNFLCSDGEHVGGPAEECTRDPSGACGYEILSCP